MSVRVTSKPIEALHTHKFSQQVEQGFLSIQVLRAIAALMVVGYHVKPRLLRMGWDLSWPEWLGCGVDIFFVISGAIMWGTTRNRDMSPRDFILRRFLRIAPLYYTVTGLVVLMMALAPALVAGGRIDSHHLLSSLAFMPSIHPVLGTMEPVLPQGWTLNYEMEFYALFALSLFLPAALRLLMIPLALVAAVVIGQHSGPNTVLGFFTSPIILEFGFGVLISAILMDGYRLAKWQAVSLLILGAIGIPATWPLVESGIPRACISGVCAAMIVAGAMFLEAKGTMPRNRLMLRLGDASYSIYLTHGIAMSALGAIWMRLGLASDPLKVAAFVTMAIIVAACVGLLVYFVVERPLTRLSHQIISRLNALPLAYNRVRLYDGTRYR